MRDFVYVIRYLHSALRWRMYIWISLTVVSSALEGVTIGLLLPIVAVADSDSPLQRVFTSVFNYVGVEYTLTLALGAVAGVYALRTALVVLQEVYVARVIGGRASWSR